MYAFLVYLGKLGSQMKSSLRSFLAVFLAASLTALLSCAGRKAVVSKSPGLAFTPENVLPQGQDFSKSVNPYTGESGLARKGTVAASLNNVALLNKLLKPANNQAELEQIKEIIGAINKLVPSLVVIGMFNLFELEEWITSKDQTGRIVAAVLCLQQYPEKLTPAIKAKLLSILAATDVPVLRDEISKVLKSAL
jgi:hypothetical protein